MAFVYGEVRLTKLLSILVYYKNYLGEQFPETYLHISKKVQICKKDLSISKYTVDTQSKIFFLIYLHQKKENCGRFVLKRGFQQIKGNTSIWEHKRIVGKRVP